MVMEPGALREAIQRHPVRIGRYDVVKLVGRGGMGDVFEAIDLESGRRVALKTLGKLQVTPERRLLYENEFRSVADLSHRNLVPVYELGSHEDVWFVTMELVRGVDLVTYAAGEDAFPPGSDPNAFPRVRTRASRPEQPRAQTIDASAEIEAPTRAPAPFCDLTRFTNTVGQVLDALAYLHAHGVVHQDLQPNNVLVEEDGTVRILDFGLAERIDASMRRTGESPRSGISAYRAPELAVDGVGTPASDLFALGCTMVHLLTGHVPSADGYLRARVPPKVSDLVEGVPPAVVELCDRLLARDPRERPSIADVRAALGLAVAAPMAPRRSPQLVGRGAERARLADALTRARAGGSLVAVVAGGSGVGKSTLVRSCFETGPSLDATIALHGRCYERESVPFKAIDGMVDAIAARLAGFDEATRARLLPPYFEELTRVFPVLAGRDASKAPESADMLPMERRRRVLEALHELFVRLASQATLVLDVDDLQWADAESLALLDRLIRDAPAGMLLLLTLRSEEAVDREDVADFLRAVHALPEGRFVSIELGPLESRDAEELARASLTSLGLPTDLAPTIARESRGIPYFLEELAQAVSAQGDDGSEIRLDRVLGARANELPAGARALVEVLAVANSPLSRPVAFRAAELRLDISGVLATLQRGRFMRSAGVHAEDRLAIYHDRMREAVIESLPGERAAAVHLALGRTHAATLGSAPAGTALFDAARHYAEAASLLTDADERARVLGLHLAAGRSARSAGTFPLALTCFENGLALLPPDAWDHDRENALALHVGAAEAAYLTANWESMDRYIADVKRHARTAVEELPVWAVQIDALSGRHAYAAAIDAGLEVLEKLGMPLPREPDAATVAEAFGRALEGLRRLGPEGLAAMPDATDAEALGAMRLVVRLCPVAFFVNQPLLARMACEIVSASITHGLCAATPNALALFGLIMNTAGLYRESHAWGELAIRLIDRWDDRSLEAATGHVVYNFVCPWIPSLRTITPKSRAIFEIGFRSGDFEYGAYSGQTWTYMELATGAPLAPLRDEALDLGRRIRANGSLNALHIHVPFEQLLRAMTGELDDPSHLDGDGYSEDQAVANAIALGSRSAVCVHEVAIGLARYFSGAFGEASAHLEVARDHLDGAPSCWLVPYCHQFAVLAAVEADDAMTPEDRARLRPRIDASLAALRELSAQAEVNFAHRVALLEAATLGLDGNIDAALDRAREALAASEADGWTMEVALAHDLLARLHARAGDEVQARASAGRALATYERWGAAGVVRQRSRT